MFCLCTANGGDRELGAIDEIGDRKTLQSFRRIEKYTRHVLTIIRTVAQHNRNR